MPRGWPLPYAARVPAAKSRFGIIYEPKFVGWIWRFVRWEAACSGATWNFCQRLMQDRRYNMAYCQVLPYGEQPTEPPLIVRSAPSSANRRAEHAAAS